MMLLEILVILEIQRRKRCLVGEAAGRDPHVVNRTRTSALDGCCSQAPPDGSYCLVAWIGRVFFAASSCSTETRGRMDVPAELSGPDVLTGTSAGSTTVLLVPCQAERDGPDGHPQAAGRRSIAKMTGPSAEITVKPRCR